MPAFFPIVGENTDWLSFWGGYLGAIISAGVAFVILGVQYQQNNTENIKNRQLQISVLKYQQNVQWLNELKAKCVDYYNAFDQNDIINLCNFINKNTPDSLSEARRLLNILIDRNNKAVSALKFHFSNQKDDKEIALLSKLETYNLVYEALIYDAQYTIRRLEKNADVYNLYEEIDEYEKRNLIPEVTENRIFEILKSQNYIGKLCGLSNILNKLFIARKEFHPEKIRYTIQELINYEEEKINNIINLKIND